MFGDLAYVFHFPPSELLEMEFDDLMMWHSQAKRLLEAMGRVNGRG
jgi:hypothetical protein